MNPWWLVAIVPASMIVGAVVFFGAFLWLCYVLPVDGARQR